MVPVYSSTRFVPCACATAGASMATTSASSAHQVATARTPNEPRFKTLSSSQSTAPWALALADAISAL